MSVRRANHIARKSLLASLITLLSFNLPAAEAPHRFDIAPQPLASALQRLAEQAGVQIIFGEKNVAGRMSPTVRGEYATQIALKKLLARSELSYSIGADGGIAVGPAAEASNPETAPATLDAVHIVGYPPLGDGTLYNPVKSATATKTDTAIMETPLAVELVTQQVFKDQQITRMSKALENVSGTFSKPSGLNGDFDFFYLRGFYYGDRIYRDGVPIKVGYLNNGQRDAANLERLEVVKGPPSLLYGRTDPGGMVNLVTKQPETQPYHALTQQFGSWDLFRTTLDSTGPLREDKTLNYRCNFAFEKTNSFRDSVFHDRKFFSPVLRWDVSPQTRVYFEAEYLELDTMPDPGLPLINGSNAFDRQHPGTIPNVPISRFYGGANDMHRVQESLLGLNWSHAFNDEWTLRHRFNAVFPQVNNSHTVAINTATANWIVPDWLAGIAAPDQDAQHIILGHGQFRQSAQVFYNTLSLTGHVRILATEHTLLLGTDYNRATYDWHTIDYANRQLTDIYHPIHPASWGSPSLDTTARLPENWFGFYLQDQIKLPYGWQLLAGFRYDNAFVGYSDAWVYYSNNTQGREGIKIRDTALTPRFALLWQPIKQISWYGNYSENFGLPNYGFTHAGRTLAPELANQWETGIKTEWLDGRLNANLAAFRIVKENVANSDPACIVAGSFCTAYLGTARSQGLEFDLKGEIMPQWRVIGSYTYLDTQVLRDVGYDGGSGTTGQPFAVNPRHMGSFWTTYEWADGPWSGLSLGGGALLRGRLQDGVREPGYVLLNFMTAYNYPIGSSRLTLQLNVDNLLDKRYYLGSDYSPNTEYPGTPRSFIGSVRVEW